jgi:taurine dioxygenase
MRIDPLPAPMGARVSGIDLTRDDLPFAEIEAALARHQLLLVPDQHLDEAAQVAFSRRFGTPQVSVFEDHVRPEHREILVLSNVKIDGKAIGADRFGRMWHTDLSYLPSPTYATFLYAVEVPREGGGTQFASMVAAHDAMPDDLRAEVTGRYAVHSLARQQRREYPQKPVDPALVARAPDVRHPMVRIHPMTGRQALYLGGALIAFPETAGEADSIALQDRLIAYATQERFVYHHHWQVGDLVVWDNRSVMHRAMPFDPADRRIMYRTSVEDRFPV